VVSETRAPPTSFEALSQRLPRSLHPHFAYTLHLRQFLELAGMDPKNSGFLRTPKTCEIFSQLALTRRRALGRVADGRRGLRT